MNRSHKLDGVILKRFDLNEADRVLTVFTREEGKVSILAKGVKRVVSRKAGSVEAGNHSSLFVASGSNFYILQEVQVKDSYQKMKSSLGTLKYGYYILELADKILPEHEPHNDVYHLVLQILYLLDSQPRKIYIRAFEVKLLAMLGYLSITLKQLDDGSLSGHEFLNKDAGELVYSLSRNSWEQISEMSPSEDAMSRVEQFLRFRLEKVLERELRSVHLFD